MGSPKVNTTKFNKDSFFKVAADAKSYRSTYRYTGATLVRSSFVARPLSLASLSPLSFDVGLSLSHSPTSPLSHNFSPLLWLWLVFSVCCGCQCSIFTCIFNGWLIRWLADLDGMNERASERTSERLACVHNCAEHCFFICKYIYIYTSFIYIFWFQFSL